jgi:lipoprotein-releasing system permease protein
MNLPFKIAKRYFFSKHKKRFINIISIISMLVVAVGTAALIIALSVFNGLEEVVRSLHDTFNPDLKVIPAQGKTFEVNQLFIHRIEKIKGIEVVSEVIEDNALLKYRDAQMVVKLKGVSDNYLKQSNIDTTIQDGQFKLKDSTRHYAVITRLIQDVMSISLKNDVDRMQLWYPKRLKKVNLSSPDPEKSFNRQTILPSGIFLLEKSYDEYVFVPIEFTQKLLEYEHRRTSLEIKLSKNADPYQIKNQLNQFIGKNLIVQTRDEQDANLLRAIKIEKFFVYFTLSFILAVASFNIFFALMMLVLDKQKDIAVLQALGANSQTIRRIFFNEGVLIAFSGAGVGLFLGAVLCLAQQTFGFISMGTSTTVVSAYPVKLEVMDFVYTGISIIFITLMSAYYPAFIATRVEVKEQLH